MDGPAKASAPRTPALLAVVLCTLALLALTTAKAATGTARTGVHPVKIVAAGSPQHHGLTVRLDQPHVLGAASPPSVGRASRASTATSATITPSCTVDSPRMRGPPAQGCS